MGTLIEYWDREKWTSNQVCPECGDDPGNCDYCDTCELGLQCAQTAEGLAAARRDGDVLVLARHLQVGR
jgi:hypothetical protein